MLITDYIELASFLLLLILMTPILGNWIATVFDSEKRTAVERFIYRFAGVDPDQDMSGRQYAMALMSFNCMGIGVVFLIQMIQNFLPFNPQGFGHPTWDSALNTAVSFVTNTDWQGYAGETTLSNFTQMAALTVQNFASAAVGMAVVVALARGIARTEALGIGNFWSDLVRGILYILLPLSFVWALLLVSEGVLQTFSPNVQVQGLEGMTQTLPMGPVASQVAIKQLGTNGGGFFNANSAHPFENPTPLTNFLEMLAIFLVPAALTFAFGSWIKARKHAWVIFGVMLSLFLVVLVVSLWSEMSFGTMEGKEVRFGFFGSTLFAMLTTAASCGAVNAMHASLAPLTSGMALLNMMLGEVVFGGVGAGLYGMLLFVLLTVFLAGLMVGRTPEYLGKKLEAREMTLVIVAILAPSAVILLGTALSLTFTEPTGPHGFSEILYAFTSAAANNGSAFAGLNANTAYYNLMLAAGMFIGRFAVILPVLGIAQSLAIKKTSPVSSGTFGVDDWLFGILLIGVIVIVGGLTFFPALALGPIVEHFMMLGG